jgi:hypothetical protein
MAKRVFLDILEQLLIASSWTRCLQNGNTLGLTQSSDLSISRNPATMHHTNVFDRDIR